jgi:hypothetical protein
MSDTTQLIGNNYVIGKYLRIRRLQNIHRDPQGETVNITKISLFDNNNNKYTLSDSSVIKNKYSSSYYNWNGPGLIDYALVDNPTLNRMYHSAEGDMTPTILLEFKQPIPISKIEITNRQNFDRISESYVEILDSNRNIKFRKMIRAPEVIRNDPQPVVINVNILDTFENQCNSTCPTPPVCPTLPINDCNANFAPGNYAEQINTINTRMNLLQSNITQLNNLINKIKLDNTADISNLLNLKSQYSNLLSIIKTNLQNNEILQGYNTTMQIKISSSSTSEGFTNFSDNTGKHNKNKEIAYNFNDTLSNNDVTKYNIDSKRDKTIEKFANFVQPKVDVYENFTQWNNDFTGGKISLPYSTPSVVVTNNMNVSSHIPIIKKRNFENNVNVAVGNLIGNNIMQKTNKMINYWNTQI